jgi:hypothetical protein
MSSNRLTYDTCAYQSKIKQSSRELDYMMYTGKYNNNKIFPDQVSLYSGNLVDLESDLRGQTKMASDCSSKMFNQMEDYKLSKKIVEGFQNTGTIDYSKAKADSPQYAWYIILVILFPNNYKDYYMYIPVLLKLSTDQIAYLFGKSGINYLLYNHESLGDSTNKTLKNIISKLSSYTKTDKKTKKIVPSSTKQPDIVNLPIEYSTELLKFKNIMNNLDYLSVKNVNITK